MGLSFHSGFLGFVGRRSVNRVRFSGDWKWALYERENTLFASWIRMNTYTGLHALDTLVVVHSSDNLDTAEAW